MADDDSVKNDPYEEFMHAEEVASSSDDDDGMPKAPSFMFLYTCVMLLIMTFFIVLVSLGSTNRGKFEQGRHSINAAFNVMGLSGSRRILFFIHSILKIKHSAVKQALDLHDKNQIPHDSSTGDSERIYWEDGLSKEEATRLHRFVSLGFNIALSDTDEKYLVVKFPSKYVFKQGAIKTNDIFRRSFKPLLRMLGGEYSKLFIRVYGSEKPPRNLNFHTDLELSALRAYEIAKLVYDAQDISHENVYAIGYGSYLPGESEKLVLERREFIELNIHSLWGSSVKRLDTDK